MSDSVAQFPPYRQPDDAHAGHGHHGHARRARACEPGFWSKYIFSTDHKVIGIQYGFTALCFMLFGFFLMLLMRWQIAHPGMPVPALGPLLEKILGRRPRGGAISPDLYNSFGAMHGTIMVFLGVVPLAFAAFGNYVVPLMIGAPDMTFPRINMASFHAFFLGGVVMLVSFFIPGGAAQAGWTPIRRWPRPFPRTARRSGWWAWCCSSPPRCSARSTSSPPSSSCARPA